MKNRRIKYKLNENTIEDLKETLGLKGEGTQESPLIINNLLEFAEITMRTKSIYLVLRRQTITKLSIIDSENVIIEDCIINDLEITACRDLKFIRNHIDWVKELLCRDCYFEDNYIPKDDFSKLMKKTYERRTFYFVWICLGVGMLYTLFAAIALAYLYISLGSIVILIAGISLSVAMVYLLNKRFKLRKVPVNKFTAHTVKEELFIRDIIKSRPVEEEINI